GAARAAAVDVGLRPVLHPVRARGGLAHGARADLARAVGAGVARAARHAGRAHRAAAVDVGLLARLRPVAARRHAEAGDALEADAVARAVARLPPGALGAGRAAAVDPGLHPVLHAVHARRRRARPAHARVLGAVDGDHAARAEGAARAVRAAAVL